MNEFNFFPITPHPLLQPFVAKICIFESRGRLPEDERKLIVPNANLKLTLTYRNGVSAVIGNGLFHQIEDDLTLSGMIDQPVTLDPFSDTQTGTIIVELNPLGSYRIFRLNYKEVANQIVNLSDLMGQVARDLRSRLIDAASPQDKLTLLQDFLIGRIQEATPDPIYDYCINRISYTKGLVTVAQLEKETGYSSRWLQMKFAANLGTSPKTLAEIVRFKPVYQAFSAGRPPQFLKSVIYEFYYDQSHFLRSFKRFTGSSPTELANSINELSKKNFSI